MGWPRQCWREELRKTYGDHQAVKGVDLTIGRGEIVGYLGPHGAGKTCCNDDRRR